MTGVYICIGVISCVILCFIYVSYSFTKKRFVFIWPLYALRSVCYLFVTILFIPIYEFFLSVFHCIENEEHVLVHYMWSEVECFKGVHIIHSILAVFTAVVNVCMTVVVAINFFESRNIHDDPEARVNSRPNFLLLLYEILFLTSLSILNPHHYEYYYCFILFVGPLLVFTSFRDNAVYYDDRIGKLWLIVEAIHTWAGACLILAKVLEKTEFEGSILVFFLGLPFIPLIIITNRDRRIDSLLLNVNKFQSAHELASHIRYVLKLLAEESTNKESAILLDGYIEIHIRTCNKDDCPLKRKVEKNVREGSPHSMFQAPHHHTSTMNHHGGGSEEKQHPKTKLLIETIYKMFFHGIKKYTDLYERRDLDVTS